jgi:hypothetical protein
MVLDSCDRTVGDFEDEAAALGLSTDLHVSDFFNDSPAGTLYLFNLGLDYHRITRIQHKERRWSFVVEPRLLPGANFLLLGPGELEVHLDAHPDYYTPEIRRQVLRTRDHICENYEFLDYPSEVDRLQGVRDIVGRVPRGSKCIFIIDYDKLRVDGKIVEFPAIRRYEKLVRDIADRFSHVGVISLSEILTSEAELLDGNHYVREVYLRCANKVVAVAEALCAHNEVRLDKVPLADTGTWEDKVPLADTGT